MGYYKDIAITQMEEEEFLLEEERYKRYEAMKDQADEQRKALKENYDFERDSGARP